MVQDPATVRRVRAVVVFAAEQWRCLVPLSTTSLYAKASVSCDKLRKFCKIHPRFHPPLYPTAQGVSKNGSGLLRRAIPADWPQLLGTPMEPLRARSRLARGRLSPYLVTHCPWRNRATYSSVRGPTTGKVVRTTRFRSGHHERQFGPGPSLQATGPG